LQEINRYFINFLQYLPDLFSLLLYIINKLYDFQGLLSQLHDNLIAFSKQAKEPELSLAKVATSGEKPVKVFDMASIRQIKADTSTTRNVKAVMNRFKGDDSGERVLRTVPAKFSKQLEALKAQYPNCKDFLD
jgi:hypothetical protein